MNATVVNTDERGAAVEVTDNTGIEHLITVDPEGEIMTHGVDEYPSTKAERTETEQEIMVQARRKAQYTTHAETDHDVIDPNWDPAVIEQGIEAIKDLSPAEFADHFRDLYEGLQRPQVAVPPERVDLVLKGIYLADDGGLGDTNGVIYSVRTADGEFEWRGDAGNEQVDVMVTLPTYEFEFGLQRFRDFLVNHLRAQIRDVHQLCGDVPPEQYQVDGYGMVDVDAPLATP